MAHCPRRTARAAQEPVPFINREIMELLLMFQAGVHGIPQTVTNVVEGQNTDKYQETWVEYLSRLSPHFVLVFIEHIAPGGHRWLDAETQEREGRFNNNHVTKT